MHQNLPLNPSSSKLSLIILEIGGEIKKKKKKRIVSRIKQSWILAAPSHNRCTSLVCSCYVASRDSADSKEEEIRRRNSDNGKLQYGGFMESRAGIVKIRSNKRNIEISNRVEIESSGTAPIKSNLKKNDESTVEMSQRGMMRKVSWSDAHGEDIAHVQEFEPSEEAEIGGVGKSCRCAIQ